MNEAKNKTATSGSEKKKKTGIFPKELSGIHFDDAEGWLKAYRNHSPQLVARSVVMAFRRRYFLSQKDAARKLGVSTSTLNKWENGLSVIRWKSRNDLVSNGWFQPQHFGLDVPAEEFTSVD